MLLAFLGLFDKFHCVYFIQMNKSKILILGSCKYNIKYSSVNWYQP